MKLTALGFENDTTGYYGHACHLLELCQTRLLLECPLDLSTLALFLPSFLPSRSANPESSPNIGPDSDGTVHDPTINNNIHSVNSKPMLPSQSLHMKREEHEGNTVTLSPCSSAKRRHVEDQAVGKISLVGPQTDCKWSTHYEGIKGPVLIDGEPWYKTAELGLVDVALLDVVIISNPAGMLGLPFLTKHPEFSGKVYATEATTKIGQLMMEELVVMHAEFIQVHGRPRAGQNPAWLNLPTLSTLPVTERNSFVGKTVASKPNWQPLYSAADIRVCISKVQKLRFGEEVNVDGCLRITPWSSGLGIGASSWSLIGARRNVAYIAASLATGNHSMPMNVAALAGSHTLVFSDVGSLEETFKIVTETTEFDLKTEETFGGAPGGEHVMPVRQSSSGSGSGQRNATGAGFPSSSRAGLPSGSGLAVKPPFASAGGPTTMLSSDRGKGARGEVGGTFLPDTSSDVIPEVSSMCKASIAAIRKGGSVLVPVSPFGVLPELLEEMAVQLGAVNLGHIPLIYTSPAAEEILAYGNTVPEWLCSSRQAKLYAGEALFGYVDLMQEERLRHFKALHSLDLQKVWQEPCIVFASHWSLRMGPSVHLLHRWRRNPLCLLILTEGNLDMQLALTPFKPLAMQVLEMRVPSRLRPKEVAAVIERVQPHVVLIPEFLISKLGASQNTKVKSTLSYKRGRTLRVPNFENELEVDMSAELALQIQPKSVKSKKVATALLEADLYFRDGKLSLETPTSNLPGDKMAHGGHRSRWGQVNVNELFTALKDRGLNDLCIRESTGEDSEVEPKDVNERKSFVVEIRSPSQAWVEIGTNSSHIKADEPSMRHLIADAVNSVLKVL